jgi:phospholipase C
MASKNTPKVNTLATPLDVNNHFGLLAGLDLLNNNPNSFPNAPAFPDNARSMAPAHRTRSGCRRHNR